jgi:hypothetical protein
VDLFVLSQQLGSITAGFEFGHLLSEDGKYVLFFYGVVRGEVGTELQARGKELFEGEVGGAAIVDAGVVEKGPGLAEVVVLLPISMPVTSCLELRPYKILHMLRHRIIHSEVRRAQFWQLLFFFLVFFGFCLIFQCFFAPLIFC